MPVAVQRGDERVATKKAPGAMISPAPSTPTPLAGSLEIAASVTLGARTGLAYVY
ncbi:MAG: hypothetical protein ACR2LV_06340 [Solirubrobacteraceae bacterium]